MVGLMYMKELMITKQMHQKNLTFVIIGILKISVLNINHIFEIVVMI